LKEMTMFETEENDQNSEGNNFKSPS
jgi:hypothetical protein